MKDDNYYYTDCNDILVSAKLYYVASFASSIKNDTLCVCVGRIMRPLLYVLIPSFMQSIRIKQ